MHLFVSWETSMNGMLIMHVPFKHIPKEGSTQTKVEWLTYRDKSETINIAEDVAIPSKSATRRH